MNLSLWYKFLKILNHSQGHIWAGSNKFSRKSKICEFLLWSHVKNKLPKSISGRDCPIISNKGEGVTPSVTTFHCHHSWTISPLWKYFTTLLLLTHIIVDTTQHSFCNNIKTWFHFRQGVLLFQKSSLLDPARAISGKRGSKEMTILSSVTVVSDEHN